MIDRIEDLFEMSFRGDPMAWHASSTMQLLKDITAEQAAAHPVNGRHSIWEIVHHIPAWDKEATKTMEGEVFPLYTEGEDWPKVEDTSQNAWKKAVCNMEKEHDLFVQAVWKFDSEEMNQLVNMAEGWSLHWSNTTYYQFIHGMLHHKIYHTGQIAVLKAST